MNKKTLVAVLALTALVIPLSMTGCGKADEVPTQDTVTESVTDTEVNETIEHDLVDEGIEVTPTPTPTPEVNNVEIDTSMADTYYIITAEQNVYASADTTSEVIATYPVDTEITVSGIHTETGLFEVVDANGDIIGYVDSGCCDTVKGGYQVVEEDTTTSTETPTEGTSEEKTEVEQSSGDDIWDELTEGLTEEEAQQLIDSIQSAHEEDNPAAGFWEQYGQEGNAGVGQAPIVEDNTLGTGGGTPHGMN